MRSAVLTGGGTGGHLFAALSFAEFLKGEGYNPVIIGSDYGLEKKILPKYDFEYYLLKSRGIAGKNLSDKFKGAFGVTGAYFKSLKLLGKIKPDFTIGFGGYVSFPVVLASITRGIRSAILEQNSYPGKANKILSKLCDFTFVNFEITERFFENAIVVGNPTRIEFKNFERKIKEPFIIGVIGGSRGSRSINNAMIELSKFDVNFKVIHQTGDEDYEKVKSAYQMNKKDWEVHKFIDDMKNFYKSIDFIVCRAGASTLSEIACAALGSILVPYPYAIYNHQYFNAKVFEDSKAAIIVEDINLTGKKVLSIISSLTADEIFKMSTRAKNLCKPDACKKMFEVLTVGRI